MAIMKVIEEKQDLLAALAGVFLEPQINTFVDNNLPIISSSTAVAGANGKLFKSITYVVVAALAEEMFDGEVGGLISSGLYGLTAATILKDPAVTIAPKFVPAGNARTIAQVSTPNNLIA